MTDWNSLMRDFGARVRSSRPMPVVQKAFGAKPLVGHIPFEAPKEVTEPPPKSPLSAAKTRRMDDMLTEIARKVLAKFESPARASRRDLFSAFEHAVTKHVDRLVAAASIPKAELERMEKARQEWAAERLSQRKALADELKSTRNKLGKIKTKLTQSEQALAQAQARLYASATDQYPVVPPAALDPDKDGAGLPEAAGIYFLWQGNVIEYVGKSIRLCQRVKLGGHHVLTAKHRISYVLVDEAMLTWAECHYIGLLRPFKNFGSMASHNKAKA